MSEAKKGVWFMLDYDTWDYFVKMCNEDNITPEQALRDAVESAVLQHMKTEAAESLLEDLGE